MLTIATSRKEMVSDWAGGAIQQGINLVLISPDVAKALNVGYKVFGLTKLPANVKKLLFLLIEDLKADGPVQKSWNNFSPLGDGKYHCHLNYRYVACWEWRQGEIEIEVYYVGSREKAPY